MQFVALLNEHKFRLSRSEDTALGFLMPSWSLPLQLSSHATALHGNRPVRGLGSWQSSLAFNSSHKCFTFAKHPSKQQGFKLNTIFRLFMFQLRACQEHFLSWAFYISTLIFKGKSKLAQGLGHLVLVGVTVQEQFHWPKHTELQQILRRAVLHLSHKLHR